MSKKPYNPKPLGPLGTKILNVAITVIVILAIAMKVVNLFKPMPAAARYGAYGNEYPPDDVWTGRAR